MHCAIKEKRLHRNEINNGWKLTKQFMLSYTCNSKDTLSQINRVIVGLRNHCNIQPRDCIHANITHIMILVYNILLFCFHCEIIITMIKNNNNKIRKQEHLDVHLHKNTIPTSRALNSPLPDRYFLKNEVLNF